jgi:ribosomal protein S18 acetylase RimI-like enzyme
MGSFLKARDVPWEILPMRRKNCHGKSDYYNKIACIWATTFNDPQIWEEKNDDPSVYIHRIATNPDFRGQNLVGQIVNWVKNYAVENQKNYVRMDTVGDNPGLIKYYTKCGFDFLGLLKLKNTTGLPAHYHNATVSLFQMTLNRK